MAITASYTDLLKQYGQAVGLDDLNFSAEGEALLAFNDMFVRFSLAEEKQMIILTSYITIEPMKPDVDAYASLLELNLMGIFNGAGSVGLDREKNSVTYGNSISLIGLEQDRFNKFIDSCVDIIENWRKLINSTNFPRKIETSSASFIEASATDGVVPTRV